MQLKQLTPASIVLVNETATEAFGSHLSAAAGKNGLSIALHGELGAGKTTLVRGFIRSRGYLGTVKSPTFTLIEPYDLPGSPIYHFDLYRLSTPGDLEALGVRDYFLSPAICLVEWPERAGIWINFDLRVALNYHDSGRIATLTDLTPRGATVLKILWQLLPNS